MINSQGFSFIFTVIILKLTLESNNIEISKILYHLK